MNPLIRKVATFSELLEAIRPGENLDPYMVNQAMIDAGPRGEEHLQRYLKELWRSKPQFPAKVLGDQLIISGSLNDGGKSWFDFIGGSLGARLLRLTLYTVDVPREYYAIHEAISDVAGFEWKGGGKLYLSSQQVEDIAFALLPDDFHVFNNSRQLTNIGNIYLVSGTQHILYRKDGLFHSILNSDGLWGTHGGRLKLYAPGLSRVVLGPYS